jgi:hypothetical protein
MVRGELNGTKIFTFIVGCISGVFGADSVGAH